MCDTHHEGGYAVCIKHYDATGVNHFLNEYRRKSTNISYIPHHEDAEFVAQRFHEENSTAPL
jgi:hypothetical protein